MKRALAALSALVAALACGPAPPPPDEDKGGVDEGAGTFTFKVDGTAYAAKSVVTTSEDGDGQPWIQISAEDEDAGFDAELYLGPSIPAVGEYDFGVDLPIAEGDPPSLELTLGDAFYFEPAGTLSITKSTDAHLEAAFSATLDDGDPTSSVDVTEGKLADDVTD